MFDCLLRDWQCGHCAPSGYICFSNRRRQFHRPGTSRTTLSDWFLFYPFEFYREECLAVQAQRQDYWLQKNHVLCQSASPHCSASTRTRQVQSDQVGVWQKAEAAHASLDGLEFSSYTWQVNIANYMISLDPNINLIWLHSFFVLHPTQLLQRNNIWTWTIRSRFDTLQPCPECQDNRNEFIKFAHTLNQQWWAGAI